ncbi:MAG TPA: YdcH family protein, partial [Gaiellaceae bacterium]|nr:YdcH family protein [Gaiellaceae bacterium]
NHEEFRRLHDEHQDCEERLSDLALRSLPSPEDEVEEKRLKIHKLALKDQMEEILREHRTALSA